MVLFQQDCEYDSVTVSSSEDNFTTDNWKRLGVFCGQVLPTPITSDSNVMRVVFQSDNSVQKSGFAAIFFTGKVDEVRFIAKALYQPYLRTQSTRNTACFHSSGSQEQHTKFYRSLKQGETQPMKICDQVDLVLGGFPLFGD